MSGKNENVEQLNAIIRYCEDEFTCRREYQLSYLGEKFDKKNCSKTCDNCVQNSPYTEKDCTNDAKDVINFLQNTGV